MADRRPDLNPGSPVPLYVQCADWIAFEITAGRLTPGTKLPAERDLAESWQVAYLTVRRAMRELRERGLIITVQGKGTYITEPPVRRGRR
jgi:GntR family transcriptional regulator